MWRFVLIALLALTLALLARPPVLTLRAETPVPTLPYVQTPAPVTPGPDQGPPPTLPPVWTPVPGTPLPDMGNPPILPPHDGWVYLPLVRR